MHGLSFAIVSGIFGVIQMDDPSPGYPLNPVTFTVVAACKSKIREASRYFERTEMLSSPFLIQQARVEKKMVPVPFILPSRTGLLIILFNMA